jgi:hypothetical protein
MHTVVRFTGPEAAIDAVGQRINATVAGLYLGRSDPRYANRISCVIATSDDWATRCKEIEESMRKLKPAIEFAHALDFELCVDIAIGPEEYQFRWMTELPMEPDLLRLLSENRVLLVVTLYGQGPDDDGANERPSTKQAI